MAEELEHNDSKIGKADNRKGVMLKALRSRLSSNVHDKLEHEDVLMNRLSNCDDIESGLKKSAIPCPIELKVADKQGTELRDPNKVPTAEA